MKKLSSIILTGLLVGASSLAYACGNEGGPAQGGMGMMQGGMGGGGMEMMHHGMMGQPSMVSSNDGGVIVMIGKTLYKYDKNLNLVKQVELPSDMPQMNMMDKQKMNMMGNKDMPMTDKKGCGCSRGMCGQTENKTSQ